MKDILSILNKDLFTNFKKLPLEERLSIIFLFTGITLSGLAVITSFIFSVPFLENLPNMVVFVMLWVVYIVFRGNLRRVSIITIFIVATLYFPFLFFMNNGIGGAVPLYFTMIVVYFAFFLKGRRLSYVVLTLIAYYIVILVVAYNNPSIVRPYEDRLTQLIDIGIAVVSIIVTLSLIAKTTFDGYKKEHDNKEKLIEEIQEKNRILNDLSIRDQLTNSFNRRYFFELLNEHISDYKKIKRDFFVFMIDIDFFKQINDKHGHVFGDDVLVQIVNTFRETVRSHDVIARYGGEEFVILCIDLDDDSAQKLAERLRKEIAALRFRGDETVTVSIGGAKYKKGETAIEVIDRADKNLYYVKNNGKNGVKL